MQPTHLNPRSVYILRILQSSTASTVISLLAGGTIESMDATPDTQKATRFQLICIIYIQIGVMN